MEWSIACPRCGREHDAQFACVCWPGERRDRDGDLAAAWADLEHAESLIRRAKKAFLRAQVGRAMPLLAAALLLAGPAGNRWN
jgi:phage terminase large subunit GpA-like protein